MLKDITIGQYFPGTTPIHKMDPRTKILSVILYIIALFSCKACGLCADAGLSHCSGEDLQDQAENHS